MPFSAKNAPALSRSALVADLEAELRASRDYRFAQHQRMMLVFLAAAQIHRAVILVLDMKSDDVFVECAAGLEVGDVEHGMAGADDVERRIEDVGRNGHGEVLIELKSICRVNNITIVIPGRASGRRPGIHNPQSWLWIWGSLPSVAPRNDG